MPSQVKVLAVDDNQVQSYAIERQLRSAGFRVTSVFRGGDALAQARTGFYDAILLDVDMPDMNGFEVCTSVRSDTRIPQPAIVFHSATHACEPVFHQAIALGGDAFLTYPIETNALEAVLLRHVALRRGAPTAEMLSCWKDIARFFGKGVRTVQRWELDRGLPVKRPGDGSKSVFADPQELRDWACKNCASDGNGSGEA